MRIRSRRLAPLALILTVAATGLAGCGADDRDDTAAPPAPPSAPAASPSASEPAPSASSPSASAPGSDDDDPADPSTWEIEEGEVGPIEIGESFAETLRELPSGWTNDPSCAWVAYWNAPDGAYTLYFARSAESGDDGPVEAIAIDWGQDKSAGVGPRTDDSRLGLGSTRQEVQAAYPQAQEQGSPIEGRSFLHVGGDDADDASLFFVYAEGQDGAQTVAVTASEAPSYEPCA